MTCRQCQAAIHPGRRFCFNCGAALVATCLACGHANQSTDRFCAACGQPVTSSPPAAVPDHILTDKSALEGERKQVTILFADLKDSMELLAGRDPEEARKVLDPALALMMDAVREYQGTVNQVMGDGIMALFGAPVALEDHAVRACHAALRMQEALARYGRELHERGGTTPRIRIGLNSGEVVVRAIGRGLAMDYTAVGASTHLAGRMEQLARPGAIFMTARVARLAEGMSQATPLGEMAIKGLAEPVTVYELTGLTGARSRLADRPGPRPDPVRGPRRWRWPRSPKRSDTLAQGGARSWASSASPASASRASSGSSCAPTICASGRYCAAGAAPYGKALAVPARHRAAPRRPRHRPRRRCGGGPGAARGSAP